MKNNLILILILVIGFLLRIILLDKFPPSLNWDEVSHGWNSYSILKTGSDEWGKVFPITNFRAYGDYPLPLNLYLTAPFILTFGLNEFTIRFPHVILGTLTIFSIYYLVLGLTKDKKLSLLTSFLASINPWYVFTSRFVLQSNLSIFLLITSMALFFNREKNKIFLPISFLFLGLTLFSYHSTRIFSPLLLIALLFIYHNELLTQFRKRVKLTLISFGLLFIFFAPLPFILSNPESRARSSVVFIVNEGTVNKIIEARNSSTLSPVLKRLIYNRPVFFTKDFAKNYIEYFSPQFLFTSGGTQYQFSVPNHGLLYLINLPFFYLGLIILVKKSLNNEKNYQLILGWLLLAPIPAAITTEHFAVLRSTTMLPIPEILTVLGIFTFYSWLKIKRINLNLFIGIYAVILLIFVENYFSNYFGNYAKNYSWSWQYGYKEIVNYAKENYDKYDAIVVTKKYGEPHEFFLFFWPWDPGEYKEDKNLVRFTQSNWWWVDRFDKFWLVNDWQVPLDDNNFVLESKGELDCNDKSCLLITSPGNAPREWSKLETINFLDNKPAFEIYEN